MSVADILKDPNPTGSLSRFTLDLINGVIEGDARASRERIKAYEAYLRAIKVPDNASPDDVANALQEGVDAGLIPRPLRNAGTTIVGRFAAQTEWRAEAQGGISIGVGAISLSLGASTSYSRQQSEASEFTITLEPTGQSLFSALAEVHTNANKQAALPALPANP